MARELQVINDFHTLMVDLFQRIARFPRHHRHSLGVDIEHRLQGVLALLIRAKYGPGDQRATRLHETNIELEVLRFQLRLARDLTILPNKGHGHVLQLLHNVGAQVGGWLKVCRTTGSKAS